MESDSSTVYLSFQQIFANELHRAIGLQLERFMIWLPLGRLFQHSIQGSDHRDDRPG